MSTSVLYWTDSDPHEVLSLGKALARRNAQANGRRLGIFKPHEEKPTKARQKAHAQDKLP